ncbi:hypothetical protein [Microcystis sp.]
MLDREGAWGIFYSVSSEEPICVNYDSVDWQQELQTLKTLGDL